MKRYVISVFIAFLLVFSLFGQAAAQEEQMKLPQYILDHYENKDEKIAGVVWFPFVPTNPPGFQWETYIIVSNWSGVNTAVNVWATDFGQDPMLRQVQLGPFEKRIFTLADWGIRNSIADVFMIATTQPMGGAAIMLNPMTGEFITALPPITIGF